MEYSLIEAELYTADVFKSRTIYLCVGPIALFLAASVISEARNVMSTFSDISFQAAYCQRFRSNGAAKISFSLNNSSGII